MKKAANEVHAGHTKDVTRTAATLLLHKRSAFRFEQEILLVWLAKASEKQEEIWLPIDAKNVVSQILISPHVPDEQPSAIKAGLASYGVDALSSRVLHAPK